MALFKFTVSYVGDSPIFDAATSNNNLAVPHHFPTGVTPSISILHLSLVHGFLADLEVTLTNPGGTSVLLFADVGGNADGMLNFDISDDWATDIDAFVFPANAISKNGDVNPQGGALLSTLATTNMSGTWNLSIFDDAGGDSGQLFSWSLFFAYEYFGRVDGTPTGDTLSGSDVVDIINGHAGNDTINGWLGNDVLAGGLGRDTMAGGAGADDFHYSLLSQSRPGAQRDRIVDFSHSDDIDLRSIDANTVAGGNQAFRFVGTKAFSRAAGEIRYSDLGAQCLVQADANGDGRADFEIMVKIPSMVAGDFLL